MVKAIYGTNTELLKRESMGIITQDMASVFKTKYVDALMEKQRYKLIKEPRFVFIGSDPNGGGSSDMSIFSCVMEYNSICIVGLETHAVKDHNGINALLCAHIEKLRSHKELADAWFIFLPEVGSFIFKKRNDYKLTNILFTGKLGAW